MTQITELIEKLKEYPKSSFAYGYEGAIVIRSTDKGDGHELGIIDLPEEYNETTGKKDDERSEQ